MKEQTFCSCVCIQHKVLCVNPVLLLVRTFCVSMIWNESGALLIVLSAGLVFNFNAPENGFNGCWRCSIKMNRLVSWLSIFKQDHKYRETSNSEATLSMLFFCCSFFIIF